MAIYQCSGCLTKTTGTIVSQAIAFTHSSKIRLSLVTWSYCNMGKKKRVYHIPFLKAAHAWNMSQSPGRCLHVLGVPGPCSLLLSPSLSTAAPKLRLRSIIVTGLFVALKIQWNTLTIKMDEISIGIFESGGCWNNEDRLMKKFCHTFHLQCIAVLSQARRKKSQGSWKVIVLQLLIMELNLICMIKMKILSSLWNFWINRQK